MKKTAALILALSLVSQSAFANCDYSKIVSNSDGTYTYSKELHICVGTMKRDLETANQQVVVLTKAIELKDLAYAKSNERLELWMNTTYKLEDRLNKIDSLQNKNNWLMFGLGIVVTGAAVWGAGQLVKR